MRGDPTPVCRYCREYTPERGHYFEALTAWVCHTCTAKFQPPNNGELRRAIASIRAAM